MMFRILLPPNLPQAAERDAIAVKLQIELGEVPEPALVPALVLLQRWCGGAQPPAFLQLKRGQLRELMEALKGQPAFAWVRTPGIAMEWVEGRIPAVSPHLVEPEKPVEKRSLSGGVAFRPSVPASRLPEPEEGQGLVDGTEHYLSVLLPSREHPSYHSLLDLLKGAGFALEPSNRRWWLRDRHKVLNFLARHGERLGKGRGLERSEGFERNTAHIRPAELVCSAEEARDGYSLTMSLRAGGADEGSIRSAMASGCGYVEQGGKVYLFAEDRLRRITEAQRALSGDPSAGLSPTRSLRVRAAAVAEASEILDSISPNFEAPESWRRRSEALRSLARLEPAPLPGAWDSLLRPYQKLGAAWLWYLRQSGLGGILADEMGLGKTLQAIGLLLASVRTAREGGRARLVVAPASLMENWRREVARFAPELRVFVHHASTRLAGAGALGAQDLVITSYGTLTRDRELFEGAEFDIVIADEAQHIKNRRSQNAQSLRSLRARSRFLLTGTPLENSLEDLRSLFEFLMPGFLHTPPTGLRGEEKAWHDRRMLARTAPYILRRTKQAVAPELPPRIEQVLWCELGPEQAALYRETQQKAERELLDMEGAGASEAKLRFAMLTQLLRLRQICCDPRLAKGAAAAQEAQEKAQESAKLEAFLELLEEAVDDGHRVLVFSQFASMLRLLQAELQVRELGSCYLDGSMTARARQQEVDRFQGDSSVPVFLLSLKAGGTGLNLTGADTVVHFDPWWNPAAEMQATDRAHRIGQTRTVTSYKLICSGTVEEKVLGLQQEKRALLAEVFEASDAAAAKLSLGDLRGLLG